MHGVQEGDDAGQKLAAELLRVLVATRQARLALRDAGGLDILMACLTSSPGQVQQSAFDALKILWSSEAGALRHSAPLHLREVWREAAAAHPCTASTSARCPALGARLLCVSSASLSPAAPPLLPHSRAAALLPPSRSHCWPQNAAARCASLMAQCMASMHAGDEDHLMQQRQKRLANPATAPTRVERLSARMRARVFESSWPARDRPAAAAFEQHALPAPPASPEATPDATPQDSVATSGAPDADTPAEPHATHADADAEALVAADAEAPADGSAAAPAAAADGTDEGEVLGAVGVSKEGVVKLYVLERLPDEALEQVRMLSPGCTRRILALWSTAGSVAHRWL
jgi:hypothetical protein